MTTRVGYSIYHTFCARFLLCENMQSSEWAVEVTCLSKPLIDPRPRSLSYQNYNLFFWKTAWQIEAKFYTRPFRDRGTEVCTTGPGHIAKMATMAIYDKNPSKISFSGISRPIAMKLDMWHWGPGPIIICSKDDPGSTVTYFTLISKIWSMMLLLEKEWKLSIFHKLLQPFLSKLVHAVIWMSLWSFMSIKGYSLTFWPRSLWF